MSGRLFPPSRTFSGPKHAAVQAQLQRTVHISDLAGFVDPLTLLEITRARGAHAGATRPVEISQYGGRREE